MGTSAHGEPSVSGKAARPEAVRWTELVEQISIAARLLRRELGRHAARVGLTEAQFSILWACSRSAPQGIGQSELADGLAFSPAHVSGIAERLRQSGLLEPERSHADRRRQLWRPAVKGRETLQQFLSELASTTSAERHAAGQIPLAEMLELTQSLARGDAA